MQMADLSKVRIRTFIDEIDIGKVSVGQNVSIRVSAFERRSFQVRFRGPLASKTKELLSFQYSSILIIKTIFYCSE